MVGCPQSENITRTNATGERTRPPGEKSKLATIRVLTLFEPGSQGNNPRSGPLWDKIVTASETAFINRYENKRLSLCSEPIFDATGAFTLPKCNVGKDLTPSGCETFTVLVRPRRLSPFLPGSRFCGSTRREYFVS